MSEIMFFQSLMLVSGTVAFLGSLRFLGRVDIDIGRNSGEQPHVDVPFRWPVLRKDS